MKLSIILVILGASAVFASESIDILSDGACMEHHRPLVSPNGQWRLGLNIDGKVVLISTHTKPILIFGNPEKCADTTICAEKNKIVIKACGKEISAQNGAAARLNDWGGLELLNKNGEVKSTVAADAWGKVEII